MPPNTVATGPLALEDLVTILASLQDQLDTLASTVRRQQAELDTLRAGAEQGRRS